MLYDSLSDVLFCLQCLFLLMFHAEPQPGHGECVLVTFGTVLEGLEHVCSYFRSMGTFDVCAVVFSDCSHRSSISFLSFSCRSLAQCKQSRKHIVLSDTSITVRYTLSEHALQLPTFVLFDVRMLISFSLIVSPFFWLCELEHRNPKNIRAVCWLCVSFGLKDIVCVEHSHQNKSILDIEHRTTLFNMK